MGKPIFFKRVSENLRSSLVSAAGFKDNPKLFIWKAIRGIFYEIIDSDRSLIIKASQAYFNGFFWTTLADIRALSCIFCLIALLLICFRVKGALESAILFVLLGFLGRIDVIYCDAGVENPVLDEYVKSLFAELAGEFDKEGLPFRNHILKAPVQERFFVKIIGRGYPPPTNSFRWCTKNLRIKPVSRFISEAATGDAVVALGLRRSESKQRDRCLERAGNGYWQTQIEAGLPKSTCRPEAASIKPWRG